MISELTLTSMRKDSNFPVTNFQRSKVIKDVALVIDGHVDQLNVIKAKK